MVTATITDNPIAFSQAMLSLALVIATGIYAYYTQSQANELKKTRKNNITPVLKSGIEALGGDKYKFKIKNTGKAAAHDLKVEFYVENKKEQTKSKFRTPLFAQNQEQMLIPPLEDADALIDGDRVRLNFEDEAFEPVIVLEYTFTDIFGKEYCNSEEMAILDILNNQPAGSIKGDIEKIRKSLEGIESKM